MHRTLVGIKSLASTPSIRLLSPAAGCGLVIKVAHLITDLDLGGAQFMLAKLVGGMNRDRFRNRVISLTERRPHWRDDPIIRNTGL